MQILRAYEIQIVKSVLISSPDQLRRLAGFKFPLVAKVVSADIIHKSDVGGVISQIENNRQAEAAMKMIIARVAKKAPRAQIEGVLFQEKINGTWEVILGAKRDPRFGPLIMFGLGGIYVNIFQDVTFRMAPVNQSQAEDMLREVTFAPLLTGVRGQPGIDRQSLIAAISSVSQIMIDFPEISELDINPAFVGIPGQGLIAVDFRVIV